MPEGRNVFGALTIEENLKVGAGMRTDKQNVAGDLESVYREFPMLAERRNAAAGMLSGGQQQMLVIGRALMAAPRLMAIDEPSLGLAPKIIDQVYENPDAAARAAQADAPDRRAKLDARHDDRRTHDSACAADAVVLEGEAREHGQGRALKQAYFGFRRPLSMTAVLQIVFDALSLGSLYALGALGIALIFGVMRLVNFAAWRFHRLLRVRHAVAVDQRRRDRLCRNLPFYLLVPLLLLVGAGAVDVVARWSCSAVSATPIRRR